MAAARGGGGSVQKGAIRGDDSCYQCNTGDTAQYRVAVSKIPLYSMLLLAYCSELAKCCTYSRYALCCAVVVPLIATLLDYVAS